MSNIYHIARKEMREFFSSIIGYAFLTLMLFITGRFFYILVSAYAQASEQMAGNPMGGDFPSVTEAVIGGLFDNLGVLLLFFTPLMAMRLFAEERRNNTLEFLMTAPVSSTEIVAGKFFGAMGFYTVFLLATAAFPLSLANMGTLDVGPVLTAYLGAWLMGAGCFAIGLFASSLTRHQFVAAVLAIVLSLSLWIVSWSGEASGNELGTYLSILEQYQGFSKGYVKLEGVVYFLSLVFFTLFATQQRLETLRRQ